MDDTSCSCGFGEDYFIFENDTSICTACGGVVASEVPPIDEQTSESHSRNVLIVDDQPFFRKRICDFLQEHEHSVLDAGQGLEAVSHLARSLGTSSGDGHPRIDLVILDLTMPGLIDGFQTLGVLKAMDESLPVFVLTASPPTQDLLQKLGRLKAKKYLNKASSDLEGLILKNLESL